MSLLVAVELCQSQTVEVMLANAQTLPQRRVKDVQVDFHAFSVLGEVRLPSLVD